MTTRILGITRFDLPFFLKNQLELWKSKVLTSPALIYTNKHIRTNTHTHPHPHPPHTHTHTLIHITNVIHSTSTQAILIRYWSFLFTSSGLVHGPSQSCTEKSLSDFPFVSLGNHSNHSCNGLIYHCLSNKPRDLIHALFISCLSVIF